MKLQTSKRTAARKSEAKQLRRENLIPAVIYVRGKAGETITVNGAEFTSLLRKVISGRLPTTKFTLVDEAGKERKVLIKDIQYNPVNYNVIHLDFEELIPDVAVNVKVPIECVGIADCIGIKLGGFLRQVIRYMRVNCLPKDIPDVFTVDVKEMNIRASKRLKDLDIPNTLRPLVDLNEVAVAIVKR